MILLLMLNFGCAPIRPEINSSGHHDVSSAVVDPAAMTYRSTWLSSGEVTLTQGVYRAPAAPGSAAELVVRLSDQQAFGTVDGKAVGAVILITQSGGTGSFYDVALLVQAADGWVNRDVISLGDRVAVHELAIRDSQVIVTMAAHGPHDPLCCPTLRLEKRFAVQADRLVATEERAVAVATAALVGPVWQWVETLYNNDTMARPPRPENYTVQFGADGTVNVRADCNRKGGRFSGSEQQIAIEVTHSTRAACPADSLEGQFVRDLTGSAIWFLKDGDLYIDIKYDTGTMRLKQ